MILVLASCSNTKFLPEDEKLYTGIKKSEVIADSIKRSERKDVESKVYWTAYYKPNNSFYLPKRVLPPFRLWTYNYLETDKEKGIQKWVYETMKEEPVLLSDVNLEQRTRKIESELFNEGYFNAKAFAKVNLKAKNPKKASVNYTIILPPAYTYRSVSYDFDGYPFSNSLASEMDKTQIQKGDRYNLGLIYSEQKRLAAALNEEGYYYFRPDHIHFVADTSVGNRKIDMQVGLSNAVPQDAFRPFKLGSVKVSLNAIEPSETDTMEKAGIQIIRNGNFIDPELIAKAIYLQPDSLYSKNAHDNTFRYLANLGVFRLVDIKFEPYSDSTNILNANIALHEMEKIDLSLETSFVSKSNGFAGPALVGSLSDQNLFGGGEKLTLSLKAGFEWQLYNPVNTGLGFNSYELGLNTSLSLPKIYAPFGFSSFKNVYIPRTHIRLGFDLQNRVQYYKMNSFNASFGYSWKHSMEAQHYIGLVDFNIVDLVDTTAAFSEIYQQNPSIRRSFDDQFIFSIRYKYIYDNSANQLRKNSFYYEMGLGTAGGVLALFDKHIINPSEGGSGILFGNEYSQFVKFNSDLRYYRKFGQRGTLATRALLGVGFPYGNSSVLPYVEQFFSGGANSIRGFAARSVGPGSYLIPSGIEYYDQSGDIRLEANLEYRFRMGERLFGAFFLDAGNIWLIEEDSLRPGSGFEMGNVIDELAIGTGAGIRFDINFFVVRLDLGVPLRHPGYNKAAETEDGGRWIFNNKALRQVNWFIAIGYPF